MQWCSVTVQVIPIEATFHSILSKWCDSRPGELHKEAYSTLNCFYGLLAGAKGRFLKFSGDTPVSNQRKRLEPPRSRLPEMRRNRLEIQEIPKLPEFPRRSRPPKRSILYQSRAESLFPIPPRFRVNSG